MELVALLDSLAQGRVVVFGSLPPAGRDIDLLARPAQERALTRGLAEHGLTRRGQQWVRFARCSADAVDVVDVDSWAIDPSEREALFEEAIRLDGMTHLARPAPHHAVLILAARVARDGRLDARRRERLEDALAEDPRALANARLRAPAWGARRSLPLLEGLTGGRGRGSVRPATRARRVLAVAEQIEATGVTRPRATVSACRVIAQRPPRGRVLTLSGVDGAGKSTQCEALAEALRRLGHDTVVEWTRLGSHPWLDAVAMPIKRLLTARGGAATGELTVEPAPVPQAGYDRRRRSPAMNFSWAIVVAVANVASQRAATRPHLRRGRVVVCDRYTPDSLAALRWEYGRAGSSPLHRWIVRGLSPRPARSYYLEVTPQSAFHRKGDFPVAELARQLAMYRATLPGLDVVRLDGELEREELCARIARDAWEALA